MVNFKQEYLLNILLLAVHHVVTGASEDTPLLLSVIGEVQVFLVVVYMEIKTLANLISYPPVMTICINAMIIKIPQPVKTPAKKDIQKPLMKINPMVLALTLLEENKIS
jgi:hypothetical protein